MWQGLSKYILNLFTIFYLFRVRDNMWDIYNNNRKETNCNKEVGLGELNGIKCNAFIVS